MAKDPYRYFRIEAQELLEELGRGFLDLERGRDPELVGTLLRQAHTLKGASRVVQENEIGDRAHRLEDLLSPHRESGGPVSRETIDEALQQLETIGRRVARLEVTSESEEKELSGALGEAAPRPGGPTIRISVRDLDSLLEGAFESHTAASSLRREGKRLAALRSEAAELLAALMATETPMTAPLAHRAEGLVAGLDTAQRGLHEHVDRVLGELAELHAAAAELRLVPAHTLVSDLELVVRDAARALDKDVAIHATGAETHIDAHVLAGLRRALVHLVRNSVAHGIESRARRFQEGKPATGRIDISFERQGHRLSMCCSDDGRGLDVQSVREVAVRRNLVGAADAGALDELALGRLLLRGGVSTSPRVSKISGRGVGLAAVRHAVEALKGEVQLFSSDGEGTRVEMLVPISLATLPALSVGVADTAMLVPRDSVRRALRVSRRDLSRGPTGEHLVVDGDAVPFLSLRRALHRPENGGGPSHRRETLIAIVLEAEGRQAAVGVERLGGVRNVVVQALPIHAGVDPVVSGVSFDDRGAPQPVLSPADLVRAAVDPKPYLEMAGEEPAPPVLVVDDSLTTRMLELSILETAGYDVDLAVSGEDALEQARGRRYGLFIVDVEMPGMNGFEFISAARNDPELRDIPAILVTSRADADDKRRGKEVGARAYIVKSEFDQVELLETVRTLVG